MRVPFRTRRARHSATRVAGAFATLAVVGAAVVAVGPGAPLTPAPAQAAPGSPGVPEPPTVVYQETFENGVGPAAVGLGAYTGTGGRTYTADGYWLDVEQCNGLLVQYEATVFSPGHCIDPEAAASQNNVRRLADVLGQVAAGAPGGTAGSPTDESTAATQANHAVTAWTKSVSGPNGAVQFSTGDLDLTASVPRYYSVSVDVAEASCAFLGGVNNSRLRFSFDTGPFSTQLNAAPVRACTDRAAGEYTSPAVPGGWYSGGDSIRAGRYYSDRAQLLSPAELADLSIVMRNETGEQAGNDSAFDNLTLVDATPQLDKQFDPPVAYAGRTSRLTFTVTNRQDLGAKSDWAFTDTLPTGLTLAATPRVGGTCGSFGGDPFVVSAIAGGTSIAVSGGDLGTGDAFCTISVDVTSSAPAAYVNGPAQVSGLVGLDTPADASVRFIRPAIRLQKDADRTAYEAVGQVIGYTFTATNTGSDPLANVTVADPLPGLTNLSCSPAAGATLAPGQSMTCTARYTVQQADIDRGSVQNTAEVVGDDLVGNPVVARATEAVPADLPAPTTTATTATTSPPTSTATTTPPKQDTSVKGAEHGGGSGTSSTASSAPGGSLARTGSDVAPLAGAGLVLAGAGLVLAGAARRRRLTA